MALVQQIGLTSITDAVNFIHLTGAVPMLRQNKRIIERPGVSGFWERLEGIQSEEFTLRGLHAFATQARIRQELEIYSTIKSLGLVNLIKDSFIYPTSISLPAYVSVIKVRPTIEWKKSVVCAQFNDNLGNEGTAGNDVSRLGEFFILESEWVLRMEST